MITNQGNAQFLKQISGKEKRFAGLIAVGISDATLTEDATQMDFGWATCPIVASYIDYDLNQVVFHGALDKELSGNIKEIGLISQSDEFIRTGLPNSVVYGFEPGELWTTDGTYEVTNNGSVGTNTYKLNDVVVGQYLAKVSSGINISRYDTIKLKVTSSSVTKINIILKNDETRYASKEITLSDGEQIITVNASDLVPTGQFDSKEIKEIRFEVVAAAGTNSIEFDVISFFSRQDGGLVARTVLAVEQVKKKGSSMELEYAVSL